MLTQTEAQPKSPHVCPHTISFFLDNRFRKIIQSPKRITGPYIKAGDTVIDIGCGPGFFSIEMAKLVGANGKVIAVDLQKKMIAHTKRKAAKYGMQDRMEFHQCEADHIGLNCKADFILAFYMVHETPNRLQFFQEIKSMLKDGGQLLVVEPTMHVSKAAFARMLMDTESAGLRAVDFPRRKGGRSVLFSP
ncbi:MAG: class I SAM-dependent methyltransferase [Deltaproteobacteria bacterium]|nr:class I SAM-dependent methyltransferase [Deltaproteobacteria bacterium]